MPLERGLGPEMGAVVADVHRDHGVDVRLGVGVVLIEGGDRVERIRLTDGAVLDVDLVVIGIGVAPEHRLARGLGPHDRQRRGVRCHLHGRARRGGGRRRGPLAEPPLRRGHARRALGQRHRDGHPRRRSRCWPATAAEPFEPIPWFWSDQYDRKIQLAGRAGARRRASRSCPGASTSGASWRSTAAADGVVGRARHEPARQGHALAVAGRGERASWDDALAAAAASGRVSRSDRSGAFLLLALALAAAVVDWIAVHQEQKAPRVRLQAAHAGAADRRAPSPSTRTTRRGAGVVRRRPRAQPRSATCSSCCRRTSSCSGWASFLLGHIAYIVGMHVDGVDGPAVPRRDRDRDGRCSP